MAKRMWASTSSGLLSLELTIEDAQSMAHSGSCDDDVAAGLRIDYIASQVAAWDAGILARELQEYGAWDESELSDDDQNRARLLWLLANDIVEAHADYATPR